MLAKIANLISSEEEQEVDWMVREVCPHQDCSRQMYLRDIPQHWVMSHGQDVGKYKSEVLDKSDSVTY